MAEKNISRPLAIENFSNKEKNLFKPALGISLDLCFIVLYVRFIELPFFDLKFQKDFGIDDFTIYLIAKKPCLKSAFLIVSR